MSTAAAVAANATLQKDLVMLEAAAMDDKSEIAQLQSTIERLHWDLAELSSSHAAMQASI